MGRTRRVQYCKRRISITIRHKYMYIGPVVGICVYLQEGGDRIGEIRVRHT